MKFSKSILAQAVGSVLAVTAASQALALDISTYNEATQVTLRISGATAVRPGLINLFKLNGANNGICADNTLDLYQSTDGLQHLALCTGRVGGNPALPAALQGTRIAVHKSDTGGSGNGVAPLVRNLGAALPDFFNVPTGGGFLTSCAGATTAPASASFSTFVQHTCPNPIGAQLEDRIPDAGISDLEPAIFRTAFTPPLTNAELGAIPGGSISAVVFGIPVTLNVRDNMQRVQFAVGNPCHPASGAAYDAADETEACMPSLTLAQVASFYTQNYTDWTSLSGANGNVAAPAGGNVLANNGETYICRRVGTSGTQATFETQLLRQRCVASVPGFATTAGDFYAPDQHVFEGSGSGNVVTCMGQRQAAGQGAIGTLSLEFSPNTSRGAAGTDSGFRFVKLNGVAPCLLPIVQSKYDFIGESTMQWRTAAVAGNPVLSGNPLTLATQVRNRIGSPAVVNDLNGSFTHPFCAGLGTGALLGNALSNAAGAPVPPFVAGGGSASDVIARPILTKTRGVNGANSCGAMIDILPSQQVN